LRIGDSLRRKIDAEVCDDSRVEPVERYEVFLRVADGDEDHRLYMIEHWFADRPEIETVSALFKEAKRDFDALYPDVEPEDFSVEVRRLRPRDDHRPHARRDTD